MTLINRPTAVWNGTAWVPLAPSALIPLRFKKVIGDGSGGITTTSATFVDIAPTFTISIPAAVGDVLQIIFNCIVQNTTTSTSYFRFNIAGTDQGPAWSLPWEVAAYRKLVHMEYWHTVVAGDLSGGTVTVKPRFHSIGGSSTIVYNTNAADFEKPTFAVQNLGAPLP